MIGTMLADSLRVYCNCVLTLQKMCNVYSTSCVRRVILENSVFKNYGEIIEKGTIL